MEGARVRSIQPEKKDGVAETRRRAGPALAFGTSFAAGFAACSIGGNWIGRTLGKETPFTLAGILLGFIYGGYELWKLVKRSKVYIAEQDAQLLAERKERGDESS
jgi:hypothetical protein